MAAQIIRARQINGMLGTNLGPWDLEQMPAEWITALEMWVEDLPRAREWKNEVNESLARLRSGPSSGSRVGRKH